MYKRQIGLCAMQECKALGAGRVIMIGRGAKLEKARELGADVCIDFEKEDPVKRVMEITNGIGADEVMECSGAADSPYKACQMVRKTGKIALIANYHDPADLALPMNTVVFNEDVYKRQKEPSFEIGNTHTLPLMKLDT